MANKRFREDKIKAEKERKYNQACEKIKIYPILGTIAAALLLLVFFFTWANIYNTGIKGPEVKFSGFNALFAALSGGYSKTGKAFGDIAVPFFYYAEDYVKALGVFTIIVFIVSLLQVAGQIVTLVTKKHMLNVICAGIGVLQFVLFLVCFIIALSMKDSRILPIYCSGNPACSIRSFAIIPAIASLIVAGISCVASYFYFKARKELK